MTGRLGRGWRLIITSLSFMVFGVCGLMLTAALPVIRVLAGPARTETLTLWLIHGFFRALVGVLQITGVMRVDLRDAGGLATPGHLIVANHPSYLDVVVLLSLIPSACCIVKRAHWSNPCLWGIVRAAGYVSNDDGVSLISEGTRRLRAGRTLIIFPEGTRSPPAGGLHPFSRSFAHISVRSGKPVQPVLITCLPAAFAKGQRWFHVPEKPFEIRIAALDTIRPPEGSPPREFEPGTVSPVAVRSLTTATRTYLQQQLAVYGFA